MKVYLINSLLIEVDWLSELCRCWYSYSVGAGEQSSVPRCCNYDQRRAAVRSFTTHMVGELPIRIGKSPLMTMSKARSPATAAGVQLEEPAAVHPDNGSEGDDD